ncbi:MAG: PIN domain-containing protein [Treponema sp.]|jgi:predicted nucleic acid-binding protein|nr:PIN domain-containing protein [Treponema sp.]
MKVVLDTNIILDIVEKREPHFSDSYQIFLKSAEREFEAIIGANSVNAGDFINSPVPAMTPADFLKNYNA